MALFPGGGELCGFANIVGLISQMFAFVEPPLVLPRAPLLSRFRMHDTTTTMANDPITGHIVSRATTHSGYQAISV